MNLDRVNGISRIWKSIFCGFAALTLLPSKFTHLTLYLKNSTVNISFLSLLAFKIIYTQLPSPNRQKIQLRH